MSGGHFNYQQYRLRDIASEIEELIAHNDDDSKDEFGNIRGNFYGRHTIEKFREAVKLLKIAEVYVQRIDWLVSGDDGEDTFHDRLQEDLEKIS